MREADIRYVPLCKDLKDVICTEPKGALIKALDNAIHDTE